MSIATLGLAMVGCNFNVALGPADAMRDVASADAMRDAPPPIDAPSTDAFVGAAVRINIKGPAHTGVDHPGAWAADLGVCPGANGFSVTDSINATDDDALFQTEAVDAALHCTVGGLPSGTYEVTLLFAEIDRAPACAVGSRVFSIDLEGTTLVTAFDLVTEGAGCALAGEFGHPVAKVFSIAVTDGVLDVRLTAPAGHQAVLGALQAVQTSSL